MARPRRWGCCWAPMGTSTVRLRVEGPISRGPFLEARLRALLPPSIASVALACARVAGTLEGGMVFKISSSGTFNRLYSFCALTNCADGGTPGAALVAASDGNFYGTTATGGTGSGCNNTAGCGTIFKITAEGQLTTL